MFVRFCDRVCCFRLQQDRLVARQGAKDKLQQLVAPLLCLRDPQALAVRAFGPIRPRISLRFEECGVCLRDGRSILSGVTGYFGHSKVEIVTQPLGGCWSCGIGKGVTKIMNVLFVSASWSECCEEHVFCGLCKE